MRAEDFVTMNANNILYQIVDINARGCMNPNGRKVLREVYRWQIREQYADLKVVRFEIVGKKTMILYCEIKEGEVQ